jgi:hypothetical protein
MASSARGDATGVDWVVVCIRRAAAGGRGLEGGEEKDWKEIGKGLCWKHLRLKFSQRI